MRLLRKASAAPLTPCTASNGREIAAPPTKAPPSCGPERRLMASGSIPVASWTPAPAMAWADPTMPLYVALAPLSRR